MVDLRWKPVAPKIVIRTRGSKFLLVDPEAPNWVVTNFLGALFINLCDGKTAIEDIIECYSRMTKNDEQAEKEVLVFFEFLNNINFFESSSTKVDPTLLHLVYLNITNRCNMRCSYCYASAGKTTNEMSTNEFLEVIGQIHEINKQSNLVFSGGEPLLRNDVFELLGYAKHLGHFVVLLSNGTMIDEPVATRLKDIGVDEVQVSIDGSSEVIHERSRMRGSFSDIMKGIECLVHHQMHTAIAPTITQLNYNDITNMFRKAFAMGVGFKPNMFRPIGSGSEHEELMVTPQLLYKLISEGLLKISIEKGVDIQKVKSYARGMKRDTCGLGSSLISISADGKVYPCHALHLEEFSMGNLKTQSLREILDLHKVLECCVSIDEVDECANCFVRYLCGGGCRAHTYYKHKSFRFRDPYCDLIKRVVEDNLFEVAFSHKKSRARQLMFP